MATFPPVSRATCNSTRNQTIRQELNNVKKKHVKFIRMHRADKERKKNCSDKLNVQYQCWLLWFHKGGCIGQGHMSKREFAKLKVWFQAKGEETQLGHVISMENVAEMLKESGLFTDVEVNNLFQGAGMDMAKPHPLDFNALSRLLSPSDPAKWSLIRKLLSMLHIDKEDDLTARVASEYGDVDADAGMWAALLPLPGESHDKDAPSIPDQINTHNSQNILYTRQNSDTVRAARKVRMKMNQIRQSLLSANLVQQQPVLPSISK